MFFWIVSCAFIGNSSFCRSAMTSEKMLNKVVNVGMIIYWINPESENFKLTATFLT